MSQREALARRLSVPYRPEINYDELCAALATDVSQYNELGRLLRRAYQVTERIDDLTIRNTLKAYAAALRPSFSERYADWEHWAARRLHELLEATSGQHPDERHIHTAQALGRLITYLHDPNHSVTDQHSPQTSEINQT